MLCTNSNSTGWLWVLFIVFIIFCGGSFSFGGCQNGGGCNNGGGCCNPCTPVNGGCAPSCC